MNETNCYPAWREQSAKIFHCKKRRDKSLAEISSKRALKNKDIERWWRLSASLSLGDRDKSQNFTTEESNTKYIRKNPSTLSAFASSRTRRNEDIDETYPAKKERWCHFRPDSTFSSQDGNSTSSHGRKRYSAEEDWRSIFSANSSQVISCRSDDSLRTSSSKDDEWFSGFAYSSSGSQAENSVSEISETPSSRRKWRSSLSEDINSYDYTESDKDSWSCSSVQLRVPFHVRSSCGQDQGESFNGEDDFDTSRTKKKCISSLPATSRDRGKGSNDEGSFGTYSAKAKENRRLCCPPATSSSSNRRERSIREDDLAGEWEEEVLPTNYSMPGKPESRISENYYATHPEENRWRVPSSHGLEKTYPKLRGISFEKPRQCDQIQDSLTKTSNSDSLQALITLENLLRVNPATSSEYKQEGNSKREVLQRKTNRENKKNLPTPKSSEGSDLSTYSDQARDSKPSYGTSDSFQALIDLEKLLLINPTNPEKSGPTESLMENSVSISKRTSEDSVKLFSGRRKESDYQPQNRSITSEEFPPKTRKNLNEKIDRAGNCSVENCINTPKATPEKLPSIFSSGPKKPNDDAQNRNYSEEFVSKMCSVPTNTKKNKHQTGKCTSGCPVSTPQKTAEKPSSIFCDKPKKPDGRAQDETEGIIINGRNNKKTKSTERKLFVTLNRSSEDAQHLKARKSVKNTPGGYQTHLATERSRLIFSRSPAKFDDKIQVPAIEKDLSVSDGYQLAMETSEGVQTRLASEKSRLVFAKVPSKSQQATDLNRGVSHVTSSNSQFCLNSKKPCLDLSTGLNNKSDQGGNSKCMLKKRQTYLTTVGSRLVFSKACDAFDRPVHNLTTRKSNVADCELVDASKGDSERSSASSISHEFKERVLTGRRFSETQNQNRVKPGTVFREDDEASKCFKNEQIRIISTPSRSGGFPCLWCKKVFSSAFNQRRHVTKHLNEDEKASFPCRLCNKKFTRKDTLKAHGLVHKNDRSHCCSRCEKRFKYRNNLQRHEKRDSCFKSVQLKWIFDSRSGFV